MEAIDYQRFESKVGHGFRLVKFNGPLAQLVEPLEATIDSTAH